MSEVPPDSQWNDERSNSDEFQEVGSEDQQEGLNPNSDKMPIDPINEKESKAPQIELLRGDLKYPSNEFMPGDLITLEISNIGDWKSTVVLLTDSRGENRYKARRRGSVVIFGTKLNFTRRFGEWVFHIEVPLIDGTETTITHAFEMKEYVETPPEILAKQIPIGTVDAPSEYEESISGKEEVEQKSDKIKEIPVNQLPGIGSTYEKRLGEQGILFVSHLAAMDASRIREITKAPMKKATQWEELAKEVMQDINHPLWKFAIIPEKEGIAQDERPVTEIKGIGKKTAEQLGAVGIRTVKELAEANLESLLSIFSEGKAKRFIQLAQEALSGEQSIKETPIPNQSDSNLETVPGIGPTFRKRLESAGINEVEQLKAIEDEKLAKILSISLKRARKIKMNLEKDKESTLGDPAHQLQMLDGLGPTYAKRLIAGGIQSIKDLLEKDEELIKELSKASLKKVKGWKSQAEELVRHES